MKNIISEKIGHLFRGGIRLRADITAATDVGKIRSANEDNFFISGVGCRSESSYSLSCSVRLGTSLLTAAVFDGMGGESCGEQAALIAASALGEWEEVLKGKKSGGLFGCVKEYVQCANDRIVAMTVEKHLIRSGCTMAAVFAKGEEISIFNIGDSRVYCFESGMLRQITTDQTLAVKKLLANIYTEQEALTSPDRHKLTSFIGADNRGAGIEPLCYHEKYKPNSDYKLLICSDGLTDMCTDEEIAEMLSCPETSDAPSLVQRALENGGEDNVTCVVICFKEI